MRPVGVVTIPGEVSVTVAVQVDATLTTGLAGTQLTTVEVNLRLTVSKPVPLLPRWLASPP
jgi:hypothetical protein